MNVVNVHERLLRATPEQVSELLATLGSAGDRIWPRQGWPRLRLDGPLSVGAKGGHGPIRYRVEAWEPGLLVRFRFAAMPGVDGWHAFEILDATSHLCVLEHRIEARITGVALLKWLLVVRHLHDACIEDALSRAQESLEERPRTTRWSPFVRLAMWWLSRRKRQEGSHVHA